MQPQAETASLQRKEESPHLARRIEDLRTGRRNRRQNSDLFFLKNWIENTLQKRADIFQPIRDLLESWCSRRIAAEGVKANLGILEDELEVYAEIQRIRDQFDTVTQVFEGKHPPSEETTRWIEGNEAKLRELEQLARKSKYLNEVIAADASYLKKILADLNDTQEILQVMQRFEFLEEEGI